MNKQPASSVHAPVMFLCEPTYFEIEYAINPWMDLTNQVDKALAQQQWQNLYACLRQLGVHIETIPPQPHLPDMVFTGDAGIVIGDVFIASNFRPVERRAESHHFQQWFKAQHYRVETLPSSVFFEGLGDVVIYGHQAIAAYGIRTSADAVPHMQKALPQLHFRCVLELVDPKYFHIGIALSWLDPETIMYVPEAFSPESRAVITRLVPNVIALDEVDAANFALNAIVVDRHLVLHRCSEQLRNRLQSLDFQVIECNVSEFVKSGGGTRCLVLPKVEV